MEQVFAQEKEKCGSLGEKIEKHQTHKPSLYNLRA